MNVSLESRVPYLDPRISEFVWKLPQDMKIRGSETKYILRQVLRKYLPENLINGPKMGFSIPLDTWLRGPLRSWSEDLLDKESINSKGYLDYDNILSIWQKHKAGKINAGPILWNVLMFQLWVENH
jgi:asparagine synthase (glutamine-hydrolysing)